MAAVSLFWDTSMAAMTSCQNAQYNVDMLSFILLLTVIMAEARSKRPYKFLPL